MAKKRGREETKPIRTWEEAEAQRRAAWGWYSAWVRENNLKHEIADLRERLKSQHRTPGEIDEKTKEFLEKALGGTGLYIG